MRRQRGRAVSAVAAAGALAGLVLAAGASPGCTPAAGEAGRAPSAWAVLPAGARPRRFWVASDGTAWAVGEKTLLRFDGRTWTRAPAPGGAQDFRLDAVWGSGPDDVWIAGDARKQFLDPVDGWPTTEGTPMLYRWDGRRLHEVPRPAPAPAGPAPVPGGAPPASGGRAPPARAVAGIQEIWGTGRDDVWFLAPAVIVHRSSGDHHGRAFSVTSEVLKGPELLRWNGSRVERCPLPDGAHPRVIGNGPEDVWVGGDQGLLHYDSCAPHLPTPQRGWGPYSVSSILGLGPRDVWASASGLWRWDGQRWTGLPSGPQNPVSVNALWVGGGRLFAASYGRSFLALSDGDWVPALSLVQSRPHWSNRGTGGDDPRVEGGAASASDGWAVLWLDHQRFQLLRHHGGRWTTGQQVPTEIVALWSRAPGRVEAASVARVAGRPTEHGALLERRGGAFAETMRLRAAPIAAWADGRGAAWLVGHDALALRWDGKRWVDTAPRPREPIGAIWQGPAGEAWAAAGQQMLRWDGRAWHSCPIPRETRAFWGSAADAVWSAGQQGLLYWNGETWSTVLAAGEVRPPGEPMSAWVHALWGSGADDVWAAGSRWTSFEHQEPHLVHWDGGAWTPMGSCAFGQGVGQLYAIAGRERGDVWAAGAGGTLLHFDGRAWRRVSSGTDADLFTLALTVDDELYVGGEGGLVQRLRPSELLRAPAVGAPCALPDRSAQRPLAPGEIVWPLAARQRALRACLKEGGEAELSVTARSDGKLAIEHGPGHAKTPAAACLDRALAGVRLPTRAHDSAQAGFLLRKEARHECP